MKTEIRDLSKVEMGELPWRVWEACSLDMLNVEEYRGGVYGTLGRDDMGVLKPYVMTMEIKGGDVFGVRGPDGVFRWLLRTYVFSGKREMVEWLNRYGIERCLEVCWGEC